MKKMAFAALALLLGLGSVFAALTEADLTPKAVNRTMKTLKGEARRTYAANILRAIAARPVDGATKVNELTSASRALILGAGSESILAIAEVYNTIPVEQLPGVAEMLSKNNFAQRVNKGADGRPLPNDVYDSLVATIVKRCAEYIETSGADSPALRISILAATFTTGSTEPDRTRLVVYDAVPVSVRAAVKSYVPAAEAKNREMIAAAAGVDAIDDTPATDPDADHVIAVGTKKEQEAAKANEKAGSADAAKAVAAAAAGTVTNSAMADAQGGKNADALKSGSSDALKAGENAAAIKASNEAAVADAKAQADAMKAANDAAKADAAAKESAVADILADAAKPAAQPAEPAAQPAEPAAQPDIKPAQPDAVIADIPAAEPAAPAVQPADAAEPAAPAADAAAKAAAADIPAPAPVAEATPKAEEPVAPAPASKPRVGDDDIPEIAVPLLSRWVANKEGANLDLMLYTIYDWEAAHPERLVRNPPIPTLPGVGNPALDLPGNSNLWQDKIDRGPIIAPPSPGYANQGI